jgi:uncharacterized protein involved in exopolysaccharide biosynthesis
MAVDPYRLRRALWNARWLLIGGVVLGGSLGVFVAKVMMGDAYRTEVLLDYDGDLAVAGLEGSSVYGLGPAAEALQRHAFLRRLAEESKFDGSLTQLGHMIDYEVDYLAETLSFGVYGDSALGSAENARLVTALFLDYHRERQAKRIEQEIRRITKRIDGAKEKAEDARRIYNEFREKHGIAHLSSEQNSMVRSAVDLRSRSELAESEIRALEAQVSSLEAQLANIPRTTVVSSGSSPEQAAYSRLRQELVSARSSLSEDHPRVQALEQQVSQLQAQIRRGGSGDGSVQRNTTYTQVDEQLRRAKADLALSRERQKGLAEMADRADSRLDSLSGIEGEASALLAEVKVNEELLGQLQVTEAALKDALEQPPSGFTVIDPGTPPEYPERDKQKKIAFLAILAVALLIALSAALWREFGGLRVATPAEVAFWGSGPVLATTPWPDDPYGLDELVAGLDDLAPEARGTLLILSGTPEDAPLARDLARRMNTDWFVDGPLAAAPPPDARVSPKPTPLTTPPPSGPYPVGGAPRQSAAPARPSTALALRPVQLVRREQRIRLEAWDGPFEGQALRRAARLADRVIVLVRSDRMSALELNRIHRRIGRKEGVAYIVVALPTELATLPDRVGKVAEFWQA